MWWLPVVSPDKRFRMQPIDIIIPVYNESPQVLQSTVNAILAAFGSVESIRVVVVDDGSPRALGTVADDKRVVCLRHDDNKGYGAALKTGIRSGCSPLIAISDADGTYPVTELPRLASLMVDQDMVIGSRTGDIRAIPFLRRLPKAALNAFASYIAGERIPDLNSGLRIFRRDLCEHYWDLFPNGFSFTSTITMGATLGGYRVRYSSIDYYRRKGASSIRPLRDTIRFFSIVSRLGLLFAPLKIFWPVALLLFAAGFFKGFGIDYPGQGSVGNASVMSMLAGVQIFMMGLLGEIIIHARGKK